MQRVLYADEGLIMCEVGHTCVAIWRTRPEPVLFERQVSALCSVISSHAEPIGFLCIVEPHTPPPSEEIRKASVEMLTSRKQHLACVAGVIADQGFKSAITRSVLSGMAFLLSGRDFRVKFTGTLEHAAIWMSGYVELGSVKTYCATVEMYRATLAREVAPPPDVSE